MSTNLGNMFRLFSVAFKPPTSDLANVVVSGDLSKAMADTWRALGLDSEKVDAFVSVLDGYRGDDA